MAARPAPEAAKALLAAPVKTGDSLVLLVGEADGAAVPTGRVPLDGTEYGGAAGLE